MPGIINELDEAAVTSQRIRPGIHDDFDVVNNTSQAPSPSGRSLLPRPVASLVTLIAQSTSLSLRVGTFFGSFAIDTARATTLTGLELSRAVVEGILVRAGRDIAVRSGGEYGRAEAESLLERSLAALHSTITSASFFASASFHLSSVTLSSVAAFSQSLLSTLDAILGSTESSRAIAAIITLIRREFRNPETGDSGEKVSVGDLLVGSIGFALLQRWGRRKTEREINENNVEESIWDVVILDSGLRADVVGTQQTEYVNALCGNVDNVSKRPASFLSLGDADENETFEAVERGAPPVSPLSSLVPQVSLPADSQHELSDDGLRLYIMNQLPPGTRASIRTDTVTARTITVDIFDEDVVEISPPPGTTMIEERFNHQDISSADPTTAVHPLPKHTVVFRTALNQSQSADLRAEGIFGPPATTGQEEDIPISTKQEDQVQVRFPKRGPPASGCDPIYKASSPTIKHPRTSLQTISSSSSVSGSENHKPGFGKTSLSRITQKVKSGAEEKLANKMPPLKKISKGLAHSVPHAVSFRGESKSDRDSAIINNTSAKATPKQLALKVKTKNLPSTVRSEPKYSVSTNKARAQVPQAQSPKRGFEKAINSHVNHIPTRSSSRASYYSVHEKSVESFVTQTDAYSLHSVEPRPNSPTLSRSHVRSSSTLSRTKSEKDITLVSLDDEYQPKTPTNYRRGSLKSFGPGIYSLAATGSETSLVLAARPSSSVYEDQSTILSLKRDGRVPRLYPDNHLVRNIQRFSCFSSASYGSNFLRVMGISQRSQARQEDDGLDHEHSSFSNHTGLPASTILLSSFVDSAGGSNGAGETAQGFPLVHYLSLDHASKAVVLTLRGTWGFEDILTDMTCDYDDLQWQGRKWQVHKGMHASAKRLLRGGGGRVMATIKAALEEFTDYGVVFCGHSLGGGVAALLATLISRPNDPGQSGSSFVTASNHSAQPLLLPADETRSVQSVGPFFLPAGRPIHVYAFGPPAVMCPSLRRATRGLITTVVNGQDVVPTLSLGVLHDFQAVSLAFKHDISDAKSHVQSRVWEGITQRIVNKFYVNQPPLVIHAGDGVGEDSWAWTTLKTLRKNLVASKLLPPGEVFVVETMRVLQRDSFTLDSPGVDGYPRLGRPATRVQLKFIRNVEARFSEIRFGSGMFGDHSPARYEASLAVLARGVSED